MGINLANRLFKKKYQQAEGELKKILRDFEIPYERIGWDHYDISLELYGVPSDWRMPEDLHKALFECGFATVFVNHTDGWETHYHESGVDGWRVRYGNKHGGGPILVEKLVASWPADWFETGYAKVIR